MLCQHRNIFPAFPQRRQPDGNYIETIVQILPKFSLFHQFFQIPVGGGDNPGVHLDGPVVSHPLKFFFLNYPQHFCLHGFVQFSNLIQKNRSFMGKLKFSNFRLNGSCVGSFHMAEHLAFQQIFRYGRTVYPDKIMAGPPAGIMNGFCYQLFACAAFSPDQHVKIIVRCLCRKLHGVIKFAADTHNPVKCRVQLVAPVQLFFQIFRFG